MKLALKNIFEKIDSLPIAFLVFILLYSITSFGIWRKYNSNPSSQVGFGSEFVNANLERTPKGVIVIKGEEENLGAGYDGQIFYFISKMFQEGNLDWPNGFDKSYRAPRVGYPILASLFHFGNGWGIIFGMYFWNLFLFFASFIFLRKLLSPSIQSLSWVYLLSPFTLGSYSVLVSDGVMVSLTILGYYALKKENHLLSFFLFALAILSKEQAILFLFPLGLFYFLRAEYRKSAPILFAAILAIAWRIYLQLTIPDWNAAKLTEFILPFEGIYKYLKSLTFDLSSIGSLARELSRVPLLVLLCCGAWILGRGNLAAGKEFRFAFFLTLLVVITASYYHFWSVYENVSRMFTISIPILLLWENEDDSIPTGFYYLVCLGLSPLFLFKVFFVTKPLAFFVFP